ncbi:MAG: malonyl-CoA decarboxylase [Pseudomonadota bacterium]|nr:malonyl-CoA decarboxylase [Pseudomonadota bacterium]
MSFFGDILTSLFERAPLLRGAMADDDKPIEVLCRDLLTSRGDVSGMSLAQLVLDRYADFNDDEKLALYTLLANEMDVSCGDAVSALQAYESAPTAANYAALTKKIEPARLQLIRRLNQTQDATTQLVAMRRDLLRLLDQHPDLAKLDIDFKNLFTTWFNRGFLVLRPITWGSPAHILEKIISYESVHAIQSWDDLRRRLQPDDRRCFAFFHPAMPDEPLIFVEVALTRGTPNSIQTILSETHRSLAAVDADTATFYSISNCQAGLAGISFGNSLIKTVVQHLLRDLPQIKTFVTLSPIPGLVKWLNETNQFDVASDPQKLAPLAAHYLLEAKHRNGQPRDAVARFHLNNGAFVEAVHADADISANGLAQSCGVMVNYRYDLTKISANHEAYANQQSVVASKAVKALAEQIQPADA